MADKFFSSTLLCLLRVMSSKPSGVALNNRFPAATVSSLCASMKMASNFSNSPKRISVTEKRWRNLAYKSSNCVFVKTFSLILSSN